MVGGGNAVRCPRLSGRRPTLARVSTMDRNGRIDPDLFDLFHRDDVFKTYVAKFLLPEQIDEVDIAPYLTNAQMANAQMA